MRINAVNVPEFVIQKTNCDWIINQATELKALFAHNSDEMISIDKVRALSCIDTMRDSLNELE